MGENLAFHLLADFGQPLTLSPPAYLFVRGTSFRVLFRGQIRLGKRVCAQQ